MAARTRLLSLFLVTMLAASCTAGSSLEPSIGEEPEPSTPETASEPGEPTPRPCDPGFVCSGELVPGEYTSTGTGVRITFTLAGEGWSGGEDTPGDGFALFNDAAVGGRHGISVVAYYGEVFSEVCSKEPTEMIGTEAADLIAFLAAVEGVDAGDPVDTRAGGLPAIRLDLTTVSPCNDPDVGDRMWLWTIPSGDFHFNDGEQVRVYAIDAGNVVVAIVIEAFPDVAGPDADYDVLLQKAEEVIATMVIAPPS
ncbi:MAG: hypothetical protein WED86_00535 [Chloroflexota bacterium]